MTPRATRASRRAVGDAAASLAVLVAAVASYAWTLALPLTGIDTIPTLAAAHVERAGELPSVLGRELRGGAQQSGAYYRPLTLLTYGVESLLWEGNARGHHATDLACHALAALAVFWMVRLAFGRGVTASFAVVGIFLIHPVVNEVVPAVSRRQEPLLVLGFACALIGAAWLPARRGWVLLLVGSLASVASVERGLVIPGIVFAYLLFERPNARTLLARVRRAALWTAPVLAIAVAFYGLRAVLFGGGGILFEPARAAKIGAQYALQLVHPQQLVDLRVPGSTLAAIAWLAGGAAATALALWVFWRSERKGTWLFAFAWIGGYGLLFAVAGQGNSWYPYTAVPALALWLATVGADGADAWRERGSARVRGALAFLLVATVALPLAVTSPVFTRYPAWEFAGGLSERFLGELRRVLDELPPDAIPVVINLPGHYRESDGELRVTRSAAILWPRSVEAWRRVHRIEREVVVLGAAEFVGTVTVPAIASEPAGLGRAPSPDTPPTSRRVAIAFEAGPSEYAAPDRLGTTIRPLPRERGRGFEFPLAAPPENRRHAVFVFDGERLLRYEPEASPGSARR